MAEDASQIREAIEETRTEIAQTMEALGHKADIKGRLSEQVKEKAEEIKTTAAESAEQVLAKIESVQGHARAAIPESAYPAKVAESLAGDGRRKAVGAAAVILLVVLLARRRSS